MMKLDPKTVFWRALEGGVSQLKGRESKTAFWRNDQTEGGFPKGI